MKLFFYTFRKILVGLSLCTILCSCLENPGIVEEEVDLHSIDIACLADEIPECEATNNGKLLHVILLEDCDNFTQSWTIKAEANGTIFCDSDGCHMSVALESYHFSPETVREGTYDLLAYIDLDGDGELDVDSEPIGCEESIEYSGSAESITISHWY